MSFWRCNIERTSDDKLHQETWAFAQFDTKLVLDSYGKWERESLRHKFKAVKGYTYSRLNSREFKMSINDVPFPLDVIGEAKQRFFDSIEVAKDNRP